MFARVSAVLALALCASATILPRTGSCNTGPVQCCNSVQDANSPSIADLLGLEGVAVGSITGLVGVTCNPITVIGAGSNSCNAQTVCCENNNFNGVVALGCTPVNLNL